ncbi:hypothetical protein MLD38_013397 [Melastoma candidum]|nr:hypothetical protein MLD38_013397 [Melastoma candidum]
MEFELVQSPSPSWIGKLQKLEALVLSLPNITSLSPEIGNLTLLRNLSLSGCKNLQELTQLPPSLSSLALSVCPSLTALPDLSPLRSLTELFIGVCGTTQIKGLEKLRSLSCLVIIRCWKLQGLPDLSELKNLRAMLLADCPGIVEIRGRLVRLETLALLNCLFLERVPKEHLVSLERFHLLCCPRIKGLEDIGDCCYNGQEGINESGTLKDVIITADKNARNLYLEGFLDVIWKSIYNQE